MNDNGISPGFYWVTFRNEQKAPAEICRLSNGMWFRTGSTYGAPHWACIVAAGPLLLEATIAH